MDSSKLELEKMYDGVGMDRKGEIYSARDLRGRPLRSVFRFNLATHYFMLRKINAMLRLGRFRPPARLLEIGCMVGHYSFYLRRLGFRVSGVDLSRRSIDVARQLASDLGMNDIIFEACDVEKLTGAIAKDSFDGVFSFSTLRYLADPLPAIRQIYRVVRPSGTAVLDFPNIECPWFERLKPFTKLAPHIHDHLFTQEQIENYFTEAGFRDVRSEILMFSHKSVPFFAVPGFVFVDSVLENVPPTSRSAAIIFCRGVKI